VEFQEVDVRPMTPAGERVLAAASELFYTRGIHAVGVDLIAETAGTTKKTLYDRFGSKDALIAAYLNRRLDRWRTFVDDYLAAHHPEPGPARVLGMVDALEAWLDQHRCGCAFINANAELTAMDHPAREVIRREKQWTRERYTQLAAEAGLPDPATLGAGLHLVHEGAIVASTAGADPDAITHARAAATTLVSAMQ
jgi:AcrR family transcriptional regulator